MNWKGLFAMITMQELHEKVKGVFYFATVEDNQPRVRPFGFTMLFEDKVYFGVGTHKATYKQLLENPYCELCTFKDGTFMRVRGKAVFDDRPEVQEYMYQEGPFLKKTYNEETGLHHICFYLDELSVMEYVGLEGKKLI